MERRRAGDDFDGYDDGGRDEPEERGKRRHRRRKRVRVREARGRETQPNFDYEVPPLVKYTRWAVIALTVFVLVVGGLFGLHFYMIHTAEANDVAFDAPRWRESGREDVFRNNAAKDTRLKMYRDLLEKEVLFNKTREEVLELLGPPDNYPYFKRIWRDCNYWVGPKRGLNKWGAIWLGVRFDKLNRVEEVQALETGVFWN